MNRSITMRSYCSEMAAGMVGSSMKSGRILIRRPNCSAEVYFNPRRYGESVLRSSNQKLLCMVSSRSDGGDANKIARESWGSDALIDHGPEGSNRRTGLSGERKLEIVIAVMTTVILGVGNRVMYKLALVPLKQYPFFLAQLATFGYVVVYSSILWMRHRSGIVTEEMLSLPKAPFLVLGFLEALGAATGMAAGAILSGASIPILSQTFLVWQLILSSIFLRRRYRANQLLGCLLVALGVILTVASGSNGCDALRQAGLFWNLLMIVSFLFQAADAVLKEIIFLDVSKRLKGGSVDLFVVNTYGSIFQALFLFMLLPFMSRLWGVPFDQLISYIKDGTACFLQVGGGRGGCEGAPLLPFLFVVINMGFNISLLHLLKISSAVVSCLSTTFIVPIAMYVFTLPLPYLGSSPPITDNFVKGSLVLFVGLLLFASNPSFDSPTLSHTEG